MSSSTHSECLLCAWVVFLPERIYSENSMTVMMIGVVVAVVVSQPHAPDQLWQQCGSHHILCTDGHTVSACWLLGLSCCLNMFILEVMMMYTKSNDDDEYSGSSDSSNNNRFQKYVTQSIFHFMVHSESFITKT